MYRSATVLPSLLSVTGGDSTFAVEAFAAAAEAFAVAAEAAGAGGQVDSLATASSGVSEYSHVNESK